MGGKIGSQRIPRYLDTGAKFSGCRTWRYALWRQWREGKRFCVFIGLNPSKANEIDSDNTVTRCINFAKTWGYDGLYMLNLFGICETNAKLAMSHPRPVGARTNHYMLEYLRQGELVVAAWGAQQGIEDRVAQVVKLATQEAGKPLYCLKMTQAGHPWHPLYVRADTQPILWTPR